MHPETRWARRPEVLWRSTSTGPVVAAPSMPDPTHLGGLGAVLWELLDDPADTGTLLTRTHALAGQSGPTAEQVGATLAELAALGLVDAPEPGWRRQVAPDPQVARWGRPPTAKVPARTADELISLVAALGLDRAPGRPTASEGALDAAAGAALITRSRAEKLVGLLDQAVATGAVAVDPEAEAAIGALAVATAAGCLAVEHHALLVDDLLGAAGVEHRFLKGFTFAHRFEAHPALRTFVDVDVLVRADDLDRAGEILAGAHHQRVQTEWRPGFAARWGKSVALRSAAPDAPRVEVDLHRTFASGPYALTGSPDALWARPPAEVVLGGRALPCLDLPTAFVHACVHAVTGRRTHLASLRDIAVLAHRTDLDLDAVAEVERHLGVRACVTDAVGRAWDALDLAPDPAADELRNRPMRRRDRRWLVLYGRPEVGFRRLALEAVAAPPGGRARTAYVAALARGARRSVGHGNEGPPCIGCSDR